MDVKREKLFPILIFGSFSMLFAIAQLRSGNANDHRCIVMLCSFECVSKVGSKRKREWVGVKNGSNLITSLETTLY